MAHINYELTQPKQEMRDIRLRREVDENCVVLSCYVASSGNSLPTSREKISVPSSWILDP
jgi:hypothetical protein